MNTTVKPLNSDAVAAIIGIAPVTLRIWRVHGKGPKFVKMSDAKQSGVVYFEADVLAWLEERKFASTSGYSPHGRTSSKVDSFRSAKESA